METVETVFYWFMGIFVAALFGIAAWAVFRGKAPQKPPGDPEWIPIELLSHRRKRKRQSQE